MDQILIIEKWNEKFKPGIEVEVEEVEGKKFRGRTLTRGCLKDGGAKVYVDGLVGPVPLTMVRPVAGLVDA
jgi:hypothetical protein